MTDQRTLTGDVANSSETTTENETTMTETDSAEIEIPDGLHNKPPKDQIRFAMREFGMNRASEVCEVADYVQSTCRGHMKEMADAGELEQKRDGSGYYFELLDEATTPTTPATPDESGSEVVAQRDGERSGMMPVDRNYDWSNYFVSESDITEYVQVGDEMTQMMTLINRRNDIGHSGHFVLSGPTGAAKTMAARNIAHALGAPMFTIQCSDGMEMKDVLGGPTLVGDDTWWVDGNGTKALLASQAAAREDTGFDTVVLLIDEVNRVSSRIKSALMALLDDRAEVILDGRGGEKIKGVAENLVILSTMNKGPGYITNRIDKAERRRLGEEFAIDHLGREDFAAEVTLVADQTPASIPLAKLLVETANELRDKADDSSAIDFAVTPALVLDWARGAVGRDSICDDPVVAAAKNVFIEPYFGDDPEARNLAETIVDRNVGDCPIGEDAVKEYAGIEVLDGKSEGYLDCTNCGWFESVEVASDQVKALSLCPECDGDIQHRHDTA